MHKKDLEIYRLQVLDLAEQQERLKRIKEKSYVSDTVKGSSHDHLAIERVIKIDGYKLSRENQKKIDILKMQIAEGIQEAIDRTEEVVAFINSIDDYRVREICRLRFLQGKKWKDIDQEMFLGTDYSRHLFNKYFKEQE